VDRPGCKNEARARRPDAPEAGDLERLTIAVEVEDRQLLGPDHVDHDLLDRAEHVLALDRVGEKLARNRQLDQARILIVQVADASFALGMRGLERGGSLLQRIQLRLDRLDTAWCFCFAMHHSFLQSVLCRGSFENRPCDP
jgi:hypothetical protein